MPTLNPSAPSRFVMRVSSAHMPNKVKAAYEWCAVIEVDGDLPATFAPAAIDTRIRGVRRIVQSWGPYPAKGSTPRSGKQQALTEAADLLAELSGEVSK